MNGKRPYPFAIAKQDVTAQKIDRPFEIPVDLRTAAQIGQAPVGGTIRQGKAPSLLEELGRTKLGEFAEYMLLESPVSPLDIYAGAKLAREAVKRGIGRVMTNIVPTEYSTEFLGYIRENPKAALKAILKDQPAKWMNYADPNYAFVTASEVPYRRMFGLKPRMGEEVFEFRGRDPKTGRETYSFKEGTTPIKRIREATRYAPQKITRPHFKYEERPARNVVFSGVPEEQEYTLGDFYARVQKVPKKRGVKKVYYEDVWDIGLDPHEWAKVISQPQRRPELIGRMVVHPFTDPVTIKGRTMVGAY